MRSESVPYCKDCVYYRDAYNKLMTWSKCLYSGTEKVIDTNQLAKCKLLNYKLEELKR